MKNSNAFIPPDITSFLTKARSCLDAGNAQEARMHCIAGLCQSSFNTHGLSLLAEILVATGETDAALGILSSQSGFEEKQNITLERPPSLAPLLAQVENHLLSGNMAYWQVMGEFMKDSLLVFKLRRIIEPRKLKHMPEASSKTMQSVLKITDALLENRPSSAILKTFKAGILLRMASTEAQAEGERLLRETYASAPDDHHVMAQLAAHCYYKAKQLKNANTADTTSEAEKLEAEAKMLAAKANEKDPGFVPPTLILARIAIEEQRLEDAWAILRPTMSNRYQSSILPRLYILKFLAESGCGVEEYRGIFHIVGETLKSGQSIVSEKTYKNLRLEEDQTRLSEAPAREKTERHQAMLRRRQQIAIEKAKREMDEALEASLSGGVYRGGSSFSDIAIRPEAFINRAARNVTDSKWTGFTP